MDYGAFRSQRNVAMADFDTNAILEGDGEVEDVNAADMDGCTEEKGVEIFVQPETRVRQYVDSLPERLPALDPAVVNLEPLMHALRNGRVNAPVHALDISGCLERVDTVVRAQYLELPNFVPRVLRALNGPDVPLVPKAVIDIAEEYERDINVLRRDGLGWGVPNPPVAAVATRLLIAAGLDPAVLPDEPVLDPRIRAPLMAAWERAASYLQCEARHPDKDVSAACRRRPGSRR